MLKGRTAGEAEAEQSCSFVDRLSGRVIESFAENLESGPVTHPGKQGVAAACNQAEERRIQRVGLEEVGCNMAVKVVDRDQRDLPGGSDCLGGAESHQQGPDQARPGGDRNGFDLLESEVGIFEGTGHGRPDPLEVLSGGDLGHDPPEPLMHLLRGDHVGENFLAIDDGGTGVVAGSLDCEDRQGQVPAPWRASSGTPARDGSPRHMIRASSPSLG